QRNAGLEQGAQGAREHRTVLIQQQSPEQRHIQQRRMLLQLPLRVLVKPFPPQHRCYSQDDEQPAIALHKPAERQQERRRAWNFHARILEHDRELGYHIHQQQKDRYDSGDQQHRRVDQRRDNGLSVAVADLQEFRELRQQLVQDAAFLA